jgi:predicted metallo-beta-lactamase superfamily hydrolase
MAQVPTLILYECLTNYIHRTILAKSQKQINKSCVIYFCYNHYNIIYQLVVYFVSYKYEKMVRNDKALFVKHSYNINVGTYLFVFEILQVLSYVCNSVHTYL